MARMPTTKFYMEFKSFGLVRLCGFELFTWTLSMALSRGLSTWWVGVMAKLGT